MRKIRILGAGLLIFLFGFFNPGNVWSLQEGEMAPDFTLPNLKGEEISLRDFKGKTVLIYLEGAFEYGSMYGQFVELQRLNKKYRDKGLITLVVTSCYGGYYKEGDEKRIMRFMKDKGYSFEVLLNGERRYNSYPELPRPYRRRGRPAIFLIDKEGIIRSFETHISSLSEEKVEQSLGILKLDHENVRASVAGTKEERKIDQAIKEREKGIEKASQVLKKVFPEMKNYPNFLRAASIVSYAEKLTSDLTEMRKIRVKKITYSKASEGPEITKVIEYRDPGGRTRRYIKERFETFKGKNGLRPASVEALVHLISIDTPCPTLGVSNKFPIPEDRYDRSDYLREKIFPLGKEIVKGAKNDFEAIERIVYWVRKNVKGVCKDYSMAIVFLAKGTGIPAQCVGGIVKSRHGWAECYLEGKWRPIASTGFLGKEVVLNLEAFKDRVYCVDYADASHPSSLKRRDRSLAYNYRALKITVDYAKKNGLSFSSLSKMNHLLKCWEKELDCQKRMLIGREIIEECLKEMIANKEKILPGEVLPVSLWDINIAYGYQEIKDERFLRKVKTAKVICVYSLSSSDEGHFDNLLARSQDIGLPLKEIKEVEKIISKINQQLKFNVFLINHKLKHFHGMRMDELFLPAWKVKGVSAYFLKKDEIDRMYQNLLIGSVDFLTSFVDKINSVQKDGKKVDYFYLSGSLPDNVSYRLETCLKIAPEPKKVVFVIRSSYKFGDIQINSKMRQNDTFYIFGSIGRGIYSDEYEDRYGGFQKIKLVDNSGKVYGEPPYKSGVLCNLIFKNSQQVKIEKDKDGVKITAEFE